MDPDSFIVHIKTEKSYVEIIEKIETRFDTSNFELEMQLTKGTNKQVIGLMNDESKNIWPLNR